MERFRKIAAICLLAGAGPLHADEIAITLDELPYVMPSRTMAP